MTISYSGNFCRLLTRWKGSIWRLTWKELCVYLFLYYVVRIFYNHILPLTPYGDEYRNNFERFAMTCEEYTKQIPLTFVLGFYVSNVVQSILPNKTKIIVINPIRWWRQFECLPWPEDALSSLNLVITGTDSKSQRRRHAAARYLNLTAALAWRDISSKIRRRFPTVDHLVECGLLTKSELEVLNNLSDDVKNVRWLTPLHWVQQIVMDELNENKPQPALVNSFMGELRQFRINIRKLFCYDWVCVPLVYTQVTTLATYSLFAFSLFGRQYLDPSKGYSNYRADYYVPFFTIVQFLFYVGWFKVGQDLMRPFGMDDDDIELDYIFERDVVVSYAIVDRLQMLRYIEPEDKPYWTEDDKFVPTVPLTGLASKTKQHRPVRHVHVPAYTALGDGDVEIANTRCLRVIKRSHEAEIKW